MAFELIDPGETLDKTIDWSDFVDDGGSPSDQINASTWAVSPSGPTLSGDSFTVNSATTFIAGATRGKLYELTNTVVTDLGRTGQRSITLRCEER